jgi:hypothetical protein
MKTFQKFAIGLAGLLLILIEQKLNAQNWAPVGPVQAIPKYAAEIMEAPNGDLWVGTFSGELYKFQGGTWVKKCNAFNDPQVPDFIVPDFEMDNQGRIYMAYGIFDATNLFVKVLTPSATGTTWVLKFKIIPINTAALDLCPDLQGNMYLATTYKMYKVSGTILDSIDAPNGFRPSIQENTIAFSPSNQMHVVYSEPFTGKIRFTKRNELQQSWDTLASMPAPDFVFCQFKFITEEKFVYYYDKYISFSPAQLAHRVLIRENGNWTEPADTLAIPSNEGTGKLDLDAFGNPVVNTTYGSIFIYKNGSISELPPYNPTPHQFYYSSDLHFSASRQKLIQISSALHSTTNQLFSSILELDLTLSSREKMGLEFKTIIYPNPTEGSFKILLPEGEGVRNALFLNQMGKEIWRGKIESGQTMSFLDSGMPSGIYYLSLEGFSGTERLKVVKQ